MSILHAVNAFLSHWMSLFILGTSVAGFFYPPLFIWAVPHTALFLAIIMFGMGLTISLEDFRIVLTHPRRLALGFALQFTLMPLAGWLLAVLFNLPPDLAIGFVLVGACPGGTASNVVTYLAKGDVALSVGMTIASTLLAPLATPILVYLLAGSWVSVSFWGIMLSIFQIVVAPVALGLALRCWFTGFVEKASDLCPIVSILGITVIVAGIIAANAAKISDCGLLTLALVCAHIAFGLATGRFVADRFGLNEAQSTAVSIEVGLQNSGLGVALASAHFAANPLATLPPAIYSALQNILGSLYAARCRRRLERLSR